MKRLNKKQRQIQDHIDANAKSQMASFVIDSTGTLVKYKGTYSEVYIPSSVNRIGEGAFKDCKTITKVHIPYTVRAIGNYAFSNCEKLKTVYTGFFIEYIGAAAFMGCYSLSYYSIPQSVRYIGDGAFAYCSDLMLTLIKGSKTFKQVGVAIYTKDGKTLVAYSPRAAFPEFKIPGKVTRIRANAFCGTQKLKTIVLPSGICQIEDYTFAGCSALTTVNIPANVSRIGYGAFLFCRSLTELTIPATVQSIDSNAFLTNAPLKVTYESSEENWEKVQKGKDYCAPATFSLKCKKTLGGLMTASHLKHSEKGIEKANEEDEKLRLIEDEYCNYFVEPDGKLIKYTGNSKKIHIPEGVTSIDNKAFSQEVCKNMTELYTPKSMKTVSFTTPSGEGCPNLEKIVIAKGATVIELLPNHPMLKELVLPETVTKLSSAVFYCSQLEKVYIPGKLTDINPTAFRDNDIKEIKLSKKNRAFKLINGSLIHVETKTLFLGTAASIIPEDGSVEVIGHSAFCGRKDLKTISIPAGIKKIDSLAFQNTALESITIPSAVEEIGLFAFANTPIKEINIPASVKDIDTAFYGCNALKKVTVDEGNAVYKSIDNCIIQKDNGALIFCANGAQIPADGSVKSIEYGALTALEGVDTLNIPASVTEVKSNTLSYTGAHEFKAINVDPANPSYTSCDGILYNKDKTEMLFIPKRIEGKVTIPEGIEKLTSSAFANLAITEITLPKSLVTVGAYLFDHCTKLSDIYCQVSEKPEGWNAGWLKQFNLSDISATVHWAAAPKAEEPKADQITLKSEEPTQEESPVKAEISAE